MICYRTCCVCQFFFRTFDQKETKTLFIYLFNTYIMKTYYYSVATAGTQSWSDEKQYECSFSKWNDFASFCKTIATSQKTQVRGCETSGYNNQGHYFN